MRIVRALPKYVRLDVCELSIKLVCKVSPSLIDGKGFRSKYVTGYIVSILIMGRSVDVEKMSRIFRISISTTRGLLKMLPLGLIIFTTKRFLKRVKRLL